MKRTCLLIAFIALLALPVLHAQTVQISGRITDATDGMPVPGATVQVKGTTIGMVSDLDGEYVFSVPADASILVFSFLGYTTQEVPIEGRTVIDVALVSDSYELDEIVVTALGIRRNARDLSYSVQRVGGDAVENKVETDVMRALSGRIAGVHVASSGGAAGSSSSITIRGNSSALGNNQPLFVVDGIPYDNSSLATQNNNIHGSTYSNRAIDIDPNDIESITVLKSGASAALYGSRAANGVIVITTKSGGRSASRLDVSFTSTLAMEEPTKIPSYQNEYGQGANFEFNSGYFGTWGPRFDAPDLDGNGDGVAGSSVLFNHNGVTSYTNHLGQIVPYQPYPNNVKDFFNTGMVRDNALSISGGDANTNFIISMSANNHDGFIPNTSLDKYAIRVAGNQKVTDKLRAGASLNYTSVDQLGTPTGGYGVTNTSVFGHLWIIPRSYDLTGLPYEDPHTRRNIHYRSDRDNPYYISKYNDYTSQVNRTVGFFNLDYDVMPWLTASYKMGVNNYTDKRKQVYAVSTLFNDRQGSIFSDDIGFTEFESNLLLTARRDVGKVGMTAITGWNLNQRTTERQMYMGNGIIVPFINDLDNTMNVLPWGGDFTKRRLVGAFADVTFNYDHWAFLNVTGRNDWSSTLPIENNSYFYPSVTGSAILTDAIPALRNRVLSYMKVYGGVSKIGNDADPYITATTFTVNPTTGNNLGTIIAPFNGVALVETGNLLGNRELKPEFTTEYEIGADFQFFNERFGFDITYYDRVSTNQIFGVQIPASTGYISKVLNAGEITNKGVELAVRSTPVFKNQMKWDVDVNFSRNRSMVVSLFDDVEQISIGTNFTHFGPVVRVGQPYGVFEGTRFRRDDEGNLLINPQTGYAMEDTDLGIIGDPNPDFLSGLSSAFSYKGLRLGVLMEYRKGGDLYAYTINEMRSRGVVAETAIDREAGRVIDGVLADPADMSQPMLDANGNKVPNNIQITTNNFYFRGFPAAEAEIYDATTIRLRELVMSYTLPRKWTSQMKIKEATVSLIGRNLWFYAPNVPHIDPETNAFEAGNRQGIIYYYMPNARRYAVSLQIKI